MTNLFHIYKMEADALHSDLQKWLNQDTSNALVSEEMGDKDSEHFAKQSQKMQDAINMHLRKGKSYEQAVAAARVHVKEDLDEAKDSDAMKGGKLQGHMVNFKPKGKLSGDEVVKKVNDIAKSLQSNHPDKVHKGAYSHGYGDYSFSDEHRGPKSGYVVVKSKEHLDAVKQHIKSHGATIQEEASQDKAKKLKTLLTRHSELAIAANKDGDHEAVKYHQAKMNDAKSQMAKLAKEEVEELDELKKSTVKSYLSKTVDPVYGIPKSKEKIKQRMKGISMAHQRIVGNKPMSEEQLNEYYTVHPHDENGRPKIIGSPTKFYGSAMSTAIKHSKEGKTVTVRYNDHKGEVDSVTIKPGEHVKSKMETLKDKRVDEEQIDELKMSTLRSYVDKAKAENLPGKGGNRGVALLTPGTRDKGVHRAVERMRKMKANEAIEEAMHDDDVKKAMSDYLAKGGKVQQVKTKKEPRAKFYTSSTAHQRGRGARAASVMYKEEYMEEAMVHPMGLHVMPVKVQGKTKYKVHAVGKHLGDSIKVGEHLSDTELDDATEMGAKIKHIKEEAVDKTIELHDDFILDIPSELKYGDYIDAAKSYSDDPAEQIMIADEFYRNKDESLVIEAFTRSDIESKIEAHRKAGSKVGFPKYSTKNGKPYAEYTVTDKEGGSTRYIHHGSTRRVERQ